MRCSVIIPTYRRCDILKECLERLEGQQYPHRDFEIIVVNDGSRDETERIVKNFAESTDIAVSYLFQENQGQGIARNLGITRARGDIIIFIGDDILVEPDFLQEHLRFHDLHPAKNQAVLGLTVWDRRMPKNHFLDFMVQGKALFGRFGGPQFAYDTLEGKEKADYRYFYTSNISLKRELLFQFCFDPDFHFYGWEDIELGYRITKNTGLDLHYNPRALGYHYHPMDESSLHGRMKSIGKSLHIFHRKHPDLRLMPSFFKKMLFSFLTNSLFVSFFHWLKRHRREAFWHYLYFYLVSKKGFLEGLREGPPSV
jgi:glycosyltransferase involved in cell wall biosynthesis